MKVAIVVLTWKRLQKLQEIFKAFSKQTNKNFDLVVSNGNLSKDAINLIEKYAIIYNKFGLNINVRHDGNEFFAFRRFFVGRDLAEQGYDVIMFVDDDVLVPKDYVENCLKQYEPKTYQSGFTWLFFNRGKDYYKFRKRVYSNKYEIHYAGTGFCMIDASIFKDKDLINKAPPGSYKIEDLWLSYYVASKKGWSLRYMDTPGVLMNGSDSVALFKQVKKDEINKAGFLRTLVQMGWKIPATLPDGLA